MHEREAGPRLDLLTALAEPTTACGLPAMREIDDGWRRAALEAVRGLDGEALADAYKELGDHWSRTGRRRVSLRFLLAEHALAGALGDDMRRLTVEYFLAQRHRLETSFAAAEAWNRFTLRRPLTDGTALAYARALREIAVIREVTADYEEGIALTRQALAVCRAFPAVPGLDKAKLQALLQQSVLQRLRGALDDATASQEQAEALLEQGEFDDLTRGVVHLRRGTLMLVLGRPEEALEAFQRAAPLFEHSSDVNLTLVRLREITCLRALGRHAEALRISDEVARWHRNSGDDYRLSQVLLERAEVEHDRDDHGAVARTLEEARPLLEGRNSLEALRWHRQQARHLLASGGSGEEAARHLAVVLEVASRPGRRDLTRVLLALSDLTRVASSGGADPALALPAARAALRAADLQRDRLSLVEDRWAVHAQREAVYAAAVALHAEAGPEAARATAQIVEIGRADLLNHILRTARVDQTTLLATRLTRPPDHPAAVDEIFALATAAHDALRAGRGGSDLPLLALPGGLPRDSDLDGLGDVVVLSQVGVGERGLWAAGVVRERGGDWRVTLTGAGDEVAALLAPMMRGEVLPAHGVTATAWERLALFLLPDDAVWRSAGRGERSVLLCPDPRLWHVPYAALTRSGVALVDVGGLTLAPSLWTQNLIQERRHTRPPGRDEDLLVCSLLDSHLPGFALERESLEAWAGGQRTLGRLADLADVAGCRGLYISGHAQLPGQPAEAGPFAVSVEELARTPEPPLVVLNGCWTGTAASRFGYDPLSLAVGAIVGGADAVVAGVGRIGSAASAEVGSGLLAALAQGRPVGEALRMAQRSVRERYRELGPFDWGGLASIGLPDVALRPPDGRRRRPPS